MAFPDRIERTVELTHPPATVWAALTTAEESRLLGVPSHSPALLFERTTTDDRGRVVEHARSVYRGDRYRITQHLRFGPASG